MLLLGIDLGTSSIKVSVVDAATQKTLASARYPEEETPVIALQAGWAEQDPADWWNHVQGAILLAHASGAYNPADIAAIGIAYQMHGLVALNAGKEVVRPSIIWCDSRAVAIGDEARDALGNHWCLQHLLNAPGNFTASKLAWVKKNEPEQYATIASVMLPGDFIAFKLTGTLSTSASALSEGIFWDFRQDRLSPEVLDYFGFDRSLFPEEKPVFAEHGRLDADIAAVLKLKPGIPVSYKAGDQPNNALALNVLRPGEVAATAGTSGVIYGVTDQPASDPQSRVNGFAHVNHVAGNPSIGILLCINGTGILNRWLRHTFSPALDYAAMNASAAAVPAGSDGLTVLPFGNGAERMLNNRIVGAHFHSIDLNLHTRGHVIRAAQEGIAFAFRYGLDIMRGMGMHPGLIRAGRANMFLSDVFVEAFVNATGIPVELYDADGSVGAALGAGIGAGIFNNEAEAFSAFRPLQTVAPSNTHAYELHYQRWWQALQGHLR